MVIVSHKHKFIYLKTIKTGGTSVECYLQQLLGPQDICTPHGDGGSFVGQNSYNGKCRNYLKPGTRVNFTARTRLGTLTQKMRFWNHMPWQKVRDAVGPAVWNSYYKFTSVRHPWDKVVSMFWWQRACQSKVVPAKPIRTFRQWLFSTVKKSNDWHIYGNGNHLVVDDVVRLEHIYEDLRRILLKLVIPQEDIDQLPRYHEKSKTRRDRQDYKKYHSARTQSHVARAFRNEISHFGYRFDSPDCPQYQPRK